MTRLCKVLNCITSLKYRTHRMVEVHQFRLLSTDDNILVVELTSSNKFTKQLFKLHKSKEWMYFEVRFTKDLQSLQIVSIRDPEAQLAHVQIEKEDEKENLQYNPEADEEYRRAKRKKKKESKSR